MSASPMKSILISAIPNETTIIFRKSSFFTSSTSTRELPTPAEVRAVGKQLESRAFRYPGLDLFVKFGSIVDLAECQHTWAIHHFTDVPVPEIYGWIYDDSDQDYFFNGFFLYMQYIDGVTLKERLPGLSSTELDDVIDQLKRIVPLWRDLEPDPTQSPFIGSLVRGPCTERAFTKKLVFNSVKEFNDYVYNPMNLDPPGEPHPYRNFLPDDVPIKFAHGDFCPFNVMVTRDGEGPCRVLAIIDWEQSGWYPGYWEYCKALYTQGGETEWAKRMPTLLEPFDNFKYWDYAILYLFGA